MLLPYSYSLQPILDRSSTAVRTLTSVVLTHLILSCRDGQQLQNEAGETTSYVLRPNKKW